VVGSASAEGSAAEVATAMAATTGRRYLFAFLRAFKKKIPFFSRLF